MAATYIIRIDDVCQEMNVPHFMRMRDMLQKHGIRPILGVVPDNRDASLDCGGGSHWSDEQFWAEIKALQTGLQWDIALHGYRHVYTTKESGLCSANRRSEFAGVPVDIQQRYIAEGMRIFRKHGVRPDAFMAPGHTFDRHTLKALTSNGLAALTDGIGLYPYGVDGVVFIPQIDSRFKKRLCGVHTLCLHINGWQEAQFAEAERFFARNAPACTSFCETLTRAEGGLTPGKALMNGLCRAYVRFKRSVKPVIIKLRGR